MRGASEASLFKKSVVYIGVERGAERDWLHFVRLIYGASSSSSAISDSLCEPLFVLAPGA